MRSKGRGCIPKLCDAPACMDGCQVVVGSLQDRWARNVGDGMGSGG